jgi:GT2 family glycosyltransferase
MPNPLKPSRKSVAISVLHWGSQADTLAAYHSLTKLKYPNFKIFVVDQADELDKSKFRKAELILPGKNLGFAGGNNLVIQQALEQHFDYVMLFNNDATIEPDTLAKLVDTFSKANNIGAVSPTILNSKPHDSVWYGGGTLELKRGYSHHNHIGARKSTVTKLSPQPTGFVSGGCVLISREALGKVGLLEERYFVYWEDIDWSAQALRHGFALYWRPDAMVVHKVSQALGVNSPTYLYYFYRNNLLFIERNTPKQKRWLAKLVFAKNYTKEIIKVLLRYKGSRTTSLAMLWRAKHDYRKRRFGKL